MSSLLAAYMVMGFFTGNRAPQRPQRASVVRLLVSMKGMGTGLVHFGHCWMSWGMLTAGRREDKKGFQRPPLCGGLTRSRSGPG